MTAPDPLAETMKKSLPRGGRPYMTFSSIDDVSLFGVAATDCAPRLARAAIPALYLACGIFFHNNKTTIYVIMPSGSTLHRNP